MVGSTEGTMTGIHHGGAFVFKINLENRQTIRRYQLAGSPGIEGNKSLSHMGAVYLGGTTDVDVWTNMVHRGNHQVPLTSPQVYVARIGATTGTAEWIQPLDTKPGGDEQREERIAGMKLNPNGDLLILLNSMNFDQGTNDMYLLDMDSETGANDFRVGSSANSPATEEEDLVIGDFHYPNDLQAILGTESSRDANILLIGFLMPFLLPLPSGPVGITDIQNIEPDNKPRPLPE